MRISSRALERLQSPSSWGIVHSDTMRQLQRLQPNNAHQGLRMPWQLPQHTVAHQAMSREAEQAEKILVSGWRKRMRQ